MSGTMRALVANMVTGRDQGLEKKLSLVGVGYRAQAAGDKAQPVARLLASGRAEMPKASRWRRRRRPRSSSAAVDKQLVGRMDAAEIRDVKPPEPYKGQGRALHGEADRAQRDEEEVTQPRDDNHD
jgi:large subunit ribosomal protein L6